VHCADMSVDRLLYVCDAWATGFRCSRRWQVRQGSVLRDQHQGCGLGLDNRFSKDPQQKFIFIADGVNEKVKVVEPRDLEGADSFGDGGRNRAVLWRTLDRHRFQGQRLYDRTYEGNAFSASSIRHGSGQ